MPNETEPRHPIGVVSERTGLTPDVLRVWERRYRVVEPKRSAGGQRLYSDADIERLSLLNRATRGGHGISHVAALDVARLDELVGEIESIAPPPPATRLSPTQAQSTVAEAMGLTTRLDPVRLETLLRRSVTRHGIVAFLDSIAAPFLKAVGDAWHDGKLSVAHEHLATAVVQRIVTETTPLLTATDGNPAILIATLEGERHASGALMAAATAATDGWHVIYLGADLPTRDIVDTARRAEVRAVGISIVVADRKARMAAELREMESALGDGITLLVGGAGARSLRDFNAWHSAVFIESMADLSTELAAIGSRTYGKTFTEGEL